MDSEAYASFERNMIPRIPVRNLYYFYAYAWDQFHFVDRVQVGVEAGPSAQEFFAELLCKATTQILKRGLDRVYLDTEEEIPLLRGRLDLLKTERHNSLEKARVWCSYGELDFDSLLNRILKATLSRLAASEQLQLDVRSDLQQAVRKLTAAGVASIRIRNHDFKKILQSKHNSFYRFVMHICQLLHYELFPTQENGSGSFASLLSDKSRMETLFEKFVRNFYRREQSSFSVSSAWIDWEQSDGLVQSIELLPTMRTDIILHSADRTIIIDTKFYSETLRTYRDKPRINSSHLYQIFSYIKNFKDPEDKGRMAEGLLLYPAVDQEVRFSVSIQGHRIRAQTIDLKQPWKDLKADLLTVLS